METIIVQKVRTERQVGIISVIQVMDRQTGEIIREDAMARQEYSIAAVARRSTQFAIDDSTALGESQYLDTFEEFAVGTHCKRGRLASKK